jgi:hypothetical protein
LVPDFAAGGCGSAFDRAAFAAAARTGAAFRGAASSTEPFRATGVGRSGRVTVRAGRVAGASAGDGASGAAFARDGFAGIGLDGSAIVGAALPLDRFGGVTTGGAESSAPATDFVRCVFSGESMGAAVAASAEARRTRRDRPPGGATAGPTLSATAGDSTVVSLCAAAWSS